MSTDIPLSFLLRWAMDECCERAGRFFGDPNRLLGIFLNQRTLGLGCDFNGGVPYILWGRKELFRVEAYRGIAPGATVWLRLDSIEDFVAQILPALPGPIVLVTTGSDYSPQRYFPAATAALLASEKIGHWFCSEFDVPQMPDKVTPVPLGIPYARRNDIWRALPGDIASGRRRNWRERATIFDRAQFERHILARVAAMRPPRERDCIAFGDFWLTDRSADARFGETREDVRRALEGNPRVIFPEQSLTQHDLLEVYSRSAFVISPPGGARDCHRTWEAILMGAIPVMKRSVVDPVYEGFPVVLVGDWSELTATNMTRWIAQHSAFWAREKIDPRLFSAHWLDKIDEAARRIAPGAPRRNAAVRRALDQRMRERLAGMQA